MEAISPAQLGRWLVIVNQVDVYRLSINKAEHNPPIAGNTYAPLSPAVALELVQTESRTRTDAQWRMSCLQKQKYMLDARN